MAVHRGLYGSTKKKLVSNADRGAIFCLPHKLREPKYSFGKIVVIYVMRIAKLKYSILLLFLGLSRIFSFFYCLPTCARYTKSNCVPPFRRYINLLDNILLVHIYYRRNAAIRMNVHGIDFSSACAIVKPAKQHHCGVLFFLAEAMRFERGVTKSTIVLLMMMMADNDQYQIDDYHFPVSSLVFVTCIAHIAEATALNCFFQFSGADNVVVGGVSYLSMCVCVYVFMYFCRRVLIW